MHQNADMPNYPPIQPRATDSLIQVIAVRLDNLHADVSGMRDVLKELASAVTKLAVIEERQGQAAQALERAFGVLEKLESTISSNKKEIDDRISTLEKAQPLQQQASTWVSNAIWLAAGAAVLYAAKKVGLV